MTRDLEDYLDIAENRVSSGMLNEIGSSMLKTDTIKLLQRIIVDISDIEYIIEGGERGDLEKELDTLTSLRMKLLCDSIQDSGNAWDLVMSNSFTRNMKEVNDDFASFLKGLSDLKSKIQYYRNHQKSWKEVGIDV